MSAKTSLSPKGGRPAKFDEPSHPVTMTLPDRVLALLEAIGSDRAKAVVKAVEAALGPDPDKRDPVDELRVSEDEALLVVSDSWLLRTIPWLRLVEISPGRHLLSLRSGVPVEQLEVTLEDLLDSFPDASPSERKTLLTLLDRIRTPRRNRAVQKEEILVVRDIGPESRGF